MNKHTRTKNELYCRKRALLISFAIPFSVMLISYIIRGAAPFGKGTLCSMDGFSQYFPMLENMAYSLKEGEPFYSFSGALGFNLWAQNAYYTNSPLWILIYILPASLRISGINLLVAAKVGVSSLLFCFYLLNQKCAARKSHTVYLSPAFSCAWALSSYMLAFINQLMWLDVIMLLPMVILGLERLFEKKSITLYVLMLFLSIWSCFFLGYMVCIFVCLYFVYLAFSKKETLKSIISKGFLFTLSSLIAAGMAAVVLIPVYKALGNTAASELTFTGLDIKNSLWQILRQFLPFGKISLEYGAPNLYCTFTAFVLMIFSFFQKKLTKRERISNFVFIIFMILSMGVNLGEYIWHGFHFPNQLPSRQSFLLIFLVLIFAYKASAQATIRVKSKKIISLIILFACCLNGFYILTSQTWISQAPSLQRFDNVMQDFTKLDDEEFVRMEFQQEKKNNGPQQYHYSGISYYSSTMSKDAYEFFQKLGFERYARNVSVYYKSDDITDNIFSVRYLIEKDRKTIIENKNALPLAFVADDDILGYSPAEYENSEKCREKFWQSLTGEKDIDLSPDVKKLKGSGLNITQFDTDLIKGTIDCKKDGILFTSIPYDEGWSFYINGNQTDTIKCADYLTCCEITEGEHEITFSYTVPGIKTGAVISAVCLSLFIITVIIHKKRRDEKEENQ